MPELSDLLSDIADPSSEHVVHQVQVPGFAQPLPVMVLGRHPAGPQGKPIVVCFHGAVDRARRRVPAFEGRFLLTHGLQGEATVLSLADPSLSMHRDLKAAWFAGNQVCDTPSAIAALVKELVGRLKPSRVVFVGGSTGAHAALVQSFHQPGSVVVVENPILHISGYNPRHVAEYRQFCWPRLAATSPLPASVNDNVADLYAKGNANVVVLLSNARDPHFWTQAVDLLNALRRAGGPERCLLQSDFYADFPGHSFPVPTWASWVRAACAASGATVADIGACHEASHLRPSGPTRASAPPAASDIEIAQRLYVELIERGQVV